MSIRVKIRREDDIFDFKNVAPFLTSDFNFEICNAGIWKDKEQFLNNHELELLYPSFEEDIENTDLKFIIPTDLKNVFCKIKSYLYTNQNNLAFEIELDYEKMKADGLDYNLTINGSRCWIMGDSLYYNVEPIIKIVSYNLEPKNIEKWIEFKDIIVIDNKTYYLKKTTRYGKWVNEIDKIILFCQNATNLNKKIIWFSDY